LAAFVDDADVALVDAADAGVASAAAIVEEVVVVVLFGPAISGCVLARTVASSGVWSQGNGVCEHASMSPGLSTI